MMSITVQIALLGFVPFALVLFALMPARRALIATYLSGWLLLPQSGFQLSGLPDYDKPAAIAIGALLGVLVLDAKRMTTFRFRWFDLPILMFCLWPLASHVYNGHGAITGLNWVIAHMFLWGVPYFLGRVYFRNADDLRELAIGIFIGGLAYAPLCWWEIRMSPQLHRQLYGFFPHSFLQHIRYGGFRPIVFMQHGIMVGVWMACATVVGFWLWRSRTLMKLGSIPMAVLVPFMFITTVFCKTGSAVVAMGLALCVFVGTRWAPRMPVLLVFALIPAIYLAARTTGAWDGEGMLAVMESIDAERAGGIRGRMRQEKYYVARAMESPLFGFADSDFIPRDDEGNRVLRGNDGFWIITFGLYGGVSLIAVFTALALPLLLVAKRHRHGEMMASAGAPATALAIVVVLFAIDCLPNGMINPIYLLAAGAVSSAVSGVAVSTTKVGAPRLARVRIAPVSNVVR